MTAEHAEYWERLADTLWEATQRPSRSVTKEEITSLCQKAFRAFYMQLWLDLPPKAVDAIREDNAKLFEFDEAKSAQENINRLAPQTPLNEEYLSKFDYYQDKCNTLQYAVARAALEAEAKRQNRAESQT